jgi:hypothetical protein
MAEADIPPWKQERQEFWDNFDSFNSENEPESRQLWVTYVITVSDERRMKFPMASFCPYRIYIEVGSYNTCALQAGTSWFGKNFDEMGHEEKKEIWELLSEWNLVELRQIGPEDSEYFATDKLTGANK